ncbi:TPA: O75 family O-antigen polymerase [Escherichia coli]
MNLLLFSVLAFGLILALAHNNKSGDINAYLMFFLVVLMVLISGLRMNDSDYIEYRKMYNEVPILCDFSLASIRDIHGEVGYLFLSSIFKTLCLPFQLFLFFIAFLSLLLTYFSFRKICLIPILSLVFYLSHAFIVRDLIQIRAGLAVSISLYSIIKFKGNKSIITGVLFASLIHSGALIIALCYPFFKKKYITLKMMLFLFLVSIIFSYLNGLNLSIQLLSQYSLLPTAISNYVGWEEYDYRVSIFTNPVFIKGVFLIVLMHKYVLSDIKNEKIIVLYNLYVLGVLAMVALSGMAILSGRLSSFLTLGESILIVYALFYKRNTPLAFLIFSFLTIVQLGYDLFISNVHPELTLIIFG